MSPGKPPRTRTRARQAATESIAELPSPPAWIEPCLPSLVEKPPTGPKWRHEVKWDGYRLCVVVDGGKATVRTRRGHDWSHRFKSIAAAAASLPCRNAIIDGEAVVLDERGHARFSALQARLDGETRAEVVLFAFDLLFFDGRDLRSLPLGSRRTELEDLIGRPTSGAILFSDEFDTDGATFLKVACERGLEGMVSKRIDLSIRPTRRLAQGQMRRQRRFRDYRLPTGRARRDCKPQGCSRGRRRAALRRLDPLAQKQSAVAGLKVKGAVWTRPELRAEIQYRGFTTAGELRHASFKGLREDI